MTFESIDALKRRHHRRLAEKVIGNLQKRQINGIYCETPDDARRTAMELIPDGAMVVQGGSVTLDETGIRKELLDARRFRFVDPYADNLSPEEKITRRKQSILADVFICSTNAVTVDGILVNRDGIGNRVAAMAFGPEKVIVVAGINKIVYSVDEAVNRINRIATPLNVGRLNRETPCAYELECSDCRSEGRICAVTTMVSRQLNPDRIHVIIVGTPLGF